MKTEIDFIKGCRATNNSYAVMEESLANYKAAASIQATVDTNSLSYTQTTHSQTWIEGKEMAPLAGACEQTSDVALTFRWLLALGLRLLLFQLSAPLSLQNWVLILGLPVDVTLVGGKWWWEGPGQRGAEIKGKGWEELLIGNKVSIENRM